MAVATERAVAVMVRRTRRLVTIARIRGKPKVRVAVVRSVAGRLLAFGPCSPGLPCRLGWRVQGIVGVDGSIARDGASGTGLGHITETSLVAVRAFATVNDGAPSCAFMAVTAVEAMNQQRMHGTFASIRGMHKGPRRTRFTAARLDTVPARLLCKTIVGAVGPCTMRRRTMRMCASANEFNVQTGLSGHYRDVL